MRRIRRSRLERRLETFLKKRQSDVSAGKSVQQAWDTARRTITMQNVFDVLLVMAGARERCYFCDDSRGTDIEHFWPKSPFPERVFVWLNMLLVCSGCNRKKGTQFPLDQDGQPLLIDPTTDDPWDHLFFEPATGQIVARWDIRRDAPDPKGATTTNEAILPLNVEAVTEGRRRVVRRLVRAIRSYLLEAGEPTARSEAFKTLQHTLIDNNDYDLTRWFLIKDGQHWEPFKTLREQHPAVWEGLQTTIAE